MKIGIIGFGKVGKKLSELAQQSQIEFLIGVKEIKEDHPQLRKIDETLENSDIIMLAIPYTAVESFSNKYIKELEGKVIIDCTNPLNADWSPMPLGENNSAAENISRLLPQSHIVKAFNTIFADVMTPSDKFEKITAFVAGDDEEARNQVITIAEKFNFHPINAGPLKSSRYLEAMAHLNIEIAVGQKGGTQAAFSYKQA